MSNSQSKGIEITKIPVIDIGPLRGYSIAKTRETATALRTASEKLGFFYIKNHGIEDSIIKTALKESLAFFNLPLDVKLQVKVNQSHRGFIRAGEAKMHNSKQTDFKESFIWGLEPPGGSIQNINPFLGPNNWPDFMPSLKTALCPYFEAASECAKNLMRGFALSLNLDPQFFLKTSNLPISRGSSLFYPPQPPGLGYDQLGVGPHTDYGCLTLLYQDQTGGLEIRDCNSEWVLAPPIQDTLVVNVGDLLARWTNDRFGSSEHRVVNRSFSARQSLALFYDPNFETIVDPKEIFGEKNSHYESSITCGDYIISRLNSSFSYRR